MENNRNWADKTVWTGDNLEVMRGMNSESVDLIYLDPPFNSKHDYAAPIGSQAAGAEFKDTWTLSDVDVTWLDLIESKHPRLHRVISAALSKSDKSYLIYMAPRLLEMRRLLKPNGSIYLHCDPTMSHYLKLLMDAIYGRKAFRREIIWKQPNPSGYKTRALNWVRNHDTLLYYAAGEPTFTPQYLPYDEDYLANFKHTDEDGRKYWLRSGKRRYLGKGIRPGSCWTDIQSMQVQSVSRSEGTGYPTQKPLKLLERIIRASSNEGDVVLDPFCGCATTLVAADRLQRNWVGIDLSGLAIKLVKSRIKDDQGLFRDITHRTDVPTRTDVGKLPRYNCAENKKRLYGEQGGNCNGCGEHFKIVNFDVDHIIARAKGGTSHLSNLQLLCGRCNSIKGDRGQEYLLNRLAE